MEACCHQIVPLESMLGQVRFEERLAICVHYVSDAMLSSSKLLPFREVGIFLLLCVKEQPTGLREICGTGIANLFSTNVAL